MSDYLPKTAGLLISMAIRADHSFGFDTSTFCSIDNLESKQISLIDQVSIIYDKAVKFEKAGLELFGRDPDAQLKEEMSGNGFYKPKLEYTYREMATLEALAKALEFQKNGN